MEIPNEEVGEEMPIPLNSTYSGGHSHMINHHHHHHHQNNHIIIPSNPPINTNLSPPNVPIFDSNKTHKKMAIKYKECLKNHAASMGGTATDGCGEFMPSGGEGTIEALTCSACNCHRNFHRKEIEGNSHSHDHHHQRFIMARSSFHNKGFHHHHHPLVPRQHMIMSYGSDQSDHDHEHDPAAPRQQMMVMKKRFRTKFSQEQKEKMFEFAEKVGWKIQKQEESFVQQFCQEVGVKRRVLKVWMHNNKHNLAKKNNLSVSDNQNQV